MGAVAKTFGVLFMILGILLLVGGIAAYVYGANDQADHESEDGPFGIAENEERTRQNEALKAGGLASGIGGLLFVVLGGILLAVSGSRNQQQQQTVVVQAGGAVGDAPTTAQSGAIRGGEALVAPQPIGPPVRSRNTFLVVGLAALGVLLVVALVLAASQQGSGRNPFSFGRDDELGNQTITGNTGAGFSLLGTPQGLGTTAYNLAPEDGTKRIVITLSWEATGTGEALLDARLEVETAEGWTSVQSVSGTSALVIDVNDDRFDLPTRLVVESGSGNPTSGQDWTAVAVFYG